MTYDTKTKLAINAFTKLYWAWARPGTTTTASQVKDAYDRAYGAGASPYDLVSSIGAEEHSLMIKAFKKEGLL